MTRTPHNPESVDMNEVSAIMATTMIKACTSVTPNTRVRMSTMALFTHPRMMQLMGIAR